MALASARAQADELTFVGGEPALDEALASKVAAAHARGFRRIGLQTNGRSLADGGKLRSLADAGLTDLHLSLHGSDSAVHDYHTGRPGSFGELLTALHGARVHGLQTVVTTVLTRSNFRVLGNLPSLLAARGVAAWFVSVPVIAGRAAASRDRMAPRLGLAMPFALHALAAAHALKMPAWVVGAPLCLLGPFAAHALPSEPRAYAPACEGCPARESCPGIDPDYLARFDGDELVARSAPAQPAAPPPEATTALTSMFVGVGEVVRSNVQPPPPAARARIALPMLGKVKPALAEAGRGSERRTGGALKEILPGLFEEKDKA